MNKQEALYFVFAWAEETDTDISIERQGSLYNISLAGHSPLLAFESLNQALHQLIEWIKKLHDGVDPWQEL